MNTEINSIRKSYFERTKQKNKQAEREVGGWRGEGVALPAEMLELSSWSMSLFSVSGMTIVYVFVLPCREAC